MVTIFYSEQVTTSTVKGGVVFDIPAMPTTSPYAIYTHHPLKTDPNSLEALLRNALETPGFRETYISVMKDFAPLARTPDGEPTLMSMRMERGITREEMAKALGISDRTMCEFENGNIEKMTWGQALMLTQALQSDLSSLNGQIRG